MDPLTIAALVGGGAKLISGIGAGIADIRATEPNEAMLREIERLERLQQADALGLTGQERTAFTEAFMDPQRALATQQMQQSQALQAATQDSGEQLRRMRARDEQAQRAMAESNRQVELLNVQAAQEQEQRLLQMQIAEEQRQAQRDAAIIRTATAGLAGAGSMAASGIAMNELTSADSGAFDAANLQRLGAAYGYAFPQYQQPISQPFNMPPGAVMGGQYMLPPAYYGYGTQPGQLQQTPMGVPATGQQGTGED